MPAKSRACVSLAREKTKSIGAVTFPTKSSDTMPSGTDLELIVNHRREKLAQLTAQEPPTPNLITQLPPQAPECGYDMFHSIYCIDMTQLRGMYFRLRTEDRFKDPDACRTVGGIVFDTRTNPLYFPRIWINMRPQFSKRDNLDVIEPYPGQYFTLVLKNTKRAVPMVVLSTTMDNEQVQIFCAQEVDVFNGARMPNNKNNTIVFRTIRRCKPALLYEWISDNPQAQGTVYWRAFVEWDWY